MPTNSPSRTTDQDRQPVNNTDGDLISEHVSRPKSPRVNPPVMTRPKQCGREWCRSEELRQVSYGDGKPYFVCPVGHVTPKPQPPDLHAIEACDEDD